MTPERLSELKNKSQQCEHCGICYDAIDVCDLFEEIDQLREKLEIAVEALDHVSTEKLVCKVCNNIDTSLPRHYEDLALEALAKLRGEK